MGYISDNLMANETIIFSAKVHPAIFLRPAIALFAAVLLFLMGVNSSPTSPSMTGPNSSSSVDFGILSLVCFSGFFFLYAIFLGLEAFIKISTTEFGVTNLRVMAKIGFIRRHTIEILLSKVESVSINQNILGRLLNFGTVVITGTGGTRERITAIAAPMDVRKKLNQIIEHYKTN